jgi:hypothetical protein
VVSLRWNLDDTFVVAADEQAVLRVVPLANALTRSEDIKTVEDRLGALQAEHPPRHNQTAVIYPGEVGERRKLPLPLRLVAHTYHAAGSRAVALMPVSPADIDSVGRVARLLRFAIDSADVEEYPPSAPCVVDGASALVARHDWVALEAGTLMVRRPPQRGELDELISNLAEVRSKANHPRQREREREQLIKLQSDLQRACERITRLTICPVCLWTQARPEKAMQPRDDHTYRCDCERCHSSWEIRQCATCPGRRRYAVLTAAGLEDNLGGDGDHLDRVFAQDLLAAPCWMRPRIYICPHCGKCPESEATRSECTRCRLTLNSSFNS